jgi:RNA polymerase sigma factor (sigma-70 family)
MDTKLNQLVSQIKAGDKHALDEFVGLIQDKVYGLALRMLYHPADAEDATQEILIKVIVHLDSFRGESKVTSWVYRIAANHLLTARKSRDEKEEISFDTIAAQIDRLEAGDWKQEHAEAYQGLLVDEVRFRCMQGFQQCLDRDHRIAFVLGAVMEVSGAQGAYILDIAPAAFRKRLSRARARLHEFMSNRCGMMNPNNSCRCGAVVKVSGQADAPDHKLRHSILGPDQKPRKELAESLKQMEEMARMSTLFKTYAEMAAPERFLRELKTMIDSDRFRLLNPH